MFRTTDRNTLGLQVLVMAFGVLSFADKNTKAGASGNASTGTKDGKAQDGQQSTTGAVTDAATATAEAEKAKRPETKINSPADLAALPEDEQKRLRDAAATRAAVAAGTQGQYVAADGSGFTDDKALAKRAMGGKGRLIARYVSPRHGDVVAVEELERMRRLTWAVTAREAVNKRMTGRKNPLPEEDLLKILRESGAPKSYLPGHASKKLYGRVLQFIQAGPMPTTEAAGAAESQQMAKVS